MSRKEPALGEFYRHFKGNVYQVKDIATHSETLEKMVVYQAMYPPFGMWVRPLHMFMEKVDKLKYPECQQTYRFERVVFEKKKTDTQTEVQTKEPLETSNGLTVQAVKETNNEDSMTVSAKGVIDDNTLKNALMNGIANRLSPEQISAEEIAQRGFMMFVDTNTYQEKYKLFLGLKDYLDKKYLTNIAVVLDIVLEDADLQTQYDSVLRCLQTFQKYESTRLR